jgi:hypothetical protein
VDIQAAETKGGDLIPVTSRAWRGIGRPVLDRDTSEVLTHNKNKIPVRIYR